MSILMPCYRLNGDLWFETAELTANVVGYHISVRGVPVDSRAYPTHAQLAIRNYRDTLDALISAGF